MLTKRFYVYNTLMGLQKHQKKFARFFSMADPSNRATPIFYELQKVKNYISAYIGAMDLILVPKCRVGRYKQLFLLDQVKIINIFTTF